MSVPRRNVLARAAVAAFTVVAVVSVVMGCLGAVQVPFYLAVGWARFLARVGPRLTVRWDMVASAAAYAAALAVGSHLFLRWLYRAMRRPEASGPAPGAAGVGLGEWRWRWTLGGLTIILLMFAAGTAAVGVAHQVAWLARSPRPLFDRDHRIGCGRNLRMIGMYLRTHAEGNGGRFPDRFGDVLLSQDYVYPGTFVCPSTRDTPAPGDTPHEQAAHLLEPGHCSYIYLGKGLSSSAADPGRAVAVEPLENHDGEGINVLFSDGHVEWLDRPAAERLLTELGFERVEPPAAGR